MISLASLLLFAFALLLIKSFYSLVFKPLRRISFYKKQGIKTHFFPIFGIMTYWRSAFNKKGDAMAESKASSKYNSKLLVSNVKDDILFVLRDPAYIKEFVLKPHLYEKSKVLDPILELIGYGLGFAEGEKWKKSRKIMASSFHFDFLKGKFAVIQNTTREFFDKLSNKDYENYEVYKNISPILGEVIGRIVFGENLGNYICEEKSLTLALGDIFNELVAVNMSPLVGIVGKRAFKSPLIPRYKRIIQRTKNFREICHKIILDRKNSPHQGGDLLEAFIVTQKLNDSEGRLSDEEIIDYFISLYIGGMDATGHVITMVLYNLAQYPEYLKELKEERNCTYNAGSALNAENLEKMDLLHCIIKETLRMYTPAPFIFFREAMVDHKILDIDVKKGDHVVPEFIASAHDEKYFEDPEKFKPERWRESAVKIDPFAFLPFSAGPRNCIGQQLAMMTMKIIVSEFLERFKFKLKKEDYKLKMIVRLLYEPEDEIVFTLNPKSN